MNKLKIKINKPLKNHAIGAIIEIEADNEGTPLDIYWRHRIRDAKQDNCIEILSNEDLQNSALKKSKFKKED